MSKYIIGIDLGTTNSVLAYIDASSASRTIQILEIPQWVAAGTTERRDSLPSFLYLAPEQEELPRIEGIKDTSFLTQHRAIPGEYARRRSETAPDRTVLSAKSWLCHNRVDRRAAILPWESSDEVDKISPVEASRLYLEYLSAAWNSAFPNDPMIEQQIVLTVPASFDAHARELTREAAIQAGFLEDKLLFLEEPQAAVYAWLADQGDSWRKNLHVGDVLLVCDVGGGTSDFSLVKVEEENGDFILNRVAVGNHLLVGGDNMDLTLALRTGELFEEKKIHLNAWQSVSLWHACRSAKETLLAAGDNIPNTCPITIPGRSSKLIGGTISVDLSADEVRAIVLDGFFPLCALTDRIKRNASVGFRQMGLPFEQETGITRHLAAFLQSHTEEGNMPTHFLLNGGVFKSRAIRDRLGEQLAKWYPDRKVININEATDLDHSVARGAAWYGLSKETGGIRIHGASVRSYYVGIESAGLAIPGRPRPLKALCVAPFGMEEGTQCDVPSAEIGLIIGENAVFRFFSSTTRREDRPGLLLDQNHIDSFNRDDSADLEETSPIETAFDSENVSNEEGEFVPVQFQTKITELGVMEIWCLDTMSDRRWKLEFSVREE